MAAGAGRSSATGRGGTYAKDICGVATGNSGVVGCHPDYFLCVCTIYWVLRRGETPGAVVEAEGSRGRNAGHGGSDFGSGKGAAATVIRHV